VLAATSQEPALPVTNLATSEQGSPATAWQTLAGGLAATLTITPPARTTIRAMGVFRTNLSAAASVTMTLYTNPGPVTVAASGAISPVNGQAVYVLPADTPADYATIVISDAANPDNHLNIPLVFAGPAWQPLTAMAWSSTMGRDEVSDLVTTRGGQTYVDLRASFRRWEIALDGVRGAEAFTQLDPLDRFSRFGGNALVIPNITSPNIQNEATYGIIKATADVTFPLGIGDRRSWRARLSERL
jgi:hypothetical protein